MKRSAKSANKLLLVTMAALRLPPFSGSPAAIARELIRSAKESFGMAKAFLRVGFFRELHDEPGLPSIREAVHSARHPDEERIVAYLQAGVCLAACGGVQHDVLDPSSKRVTSPDMVTDGVWLWPGELPYYVAVHGVKLPPEFVDHMRQNGWAVPAPSDLELRELIDRLGWKRQQ